MDKPLNIGYLIPQFPGQTHIFFWREIAAMETLGATVTLFSTRLPPKGLISHDWSDLAIKRTEYLGRIQALNILQGLVRLPWKDLRRDLKTEGRAFWKDLLICVGPAVQLIRSCQQQGVTHVHVHSCGRAALIAALANRMSGLSYSVTLHGPMSDYGIGQPFKWHNAAFATIITQKLLDEARVELGRDLPDTVRIQPMGVDIETLSRPEAYIPPAADGPIRIFSCGRLNIVKGHQDLLQAVRQLVDKGFDIQLEIAGEDDDGGNGYHQQLEARLQELSLTHNARLLGAISAEEVKRKLLSAHIFALASWHEPLGVAYMEAMACAVPTIGTDSGGVRELITDGETGLLVPPKNPAALADAIQRIAGDAPLAKSLGDAGRALVVAKFRSGLGAETILREIQAAQD